MSEKGTEFAVTEVDGAEKDVYNETLFEKNIIQIEILKKMGFVLGRESSRMILPVTDDITAEISSDIRIANAEDIPACKELFLQNFNPLFAFIPNDEEWESAIDQGGVFCIYDGDNLCGALFSQCNKSLAELRLLCVNPLYRRRGIAAKLVSAYHFTWKDQARQFAHWVDIKNENAISLYRQFGYDFDRRKANEYILNNKE